MRSFGAIALLSAAALVLALVPARAELFDYSFDMTSGPNTGLVTGRIDLPFVTAGGSGSGAADLVTIDSFPPSLAPLPQPSPATSWAIQAANLFDVTAGAITSYQFDALTTNGDTDNNAYELCFNSLGDVITPIRGCPMDLNFLGAGGDTMFGFNEDGPDGITFTPAVAAPEPSALALLGVGLFIFTASHLLKRARSAWRISKRRAKQMGPAFNTVGPVF
jgi:hypothetical protein